MVIHQTPILKRIALLMALACLLLTGCDDAQRKAELAQQERNRCRDQTCQEDIIPKVDSKKDVVFKKNDKWFVMPREYGAPNGNAIGFYWPSKVPLANPRHEKFPERGQDVDKILIEIFFSSIDIPKKPYDYKLIQLAESRGWVESRATIRPGLDVVRMKNVVESGYYIIYETYYVATNLKGSDGLPPVAGCDHDHPTGDPMNRCGFGFMWRDGIWASVRMNQKHYADFPEIYLEISRVLQLIRKA